MPHFKAAHYYNNMTIKHCLTSYYNIQIPKACSSLCLPNVPSPFFNASSAAVAYSAARLLSAVVECFFEGDDFPNTEGLLCAMIRVYHLLQIPKACSSLSLPKSPSPFCKAASANLVSSTASAICALLSFVEPDDLPNRPPNIPEELLLDV